MSSKNKQIMTTSSTRQRTFSYAHGAVSVNITLRTDIKDELKSGLEIGKRFVEDVEKELANFKKAS